MFRTSEGRLRKGKGFYRRSAVVSVCTVTSPTGKRYGTQLGWSYLDRRIHRGLGSHGDELRLRLSRISRQSRLLEVGDDYH